MAQQRHQKIKLETLISAERDKGRRYHYTHQHAAVMLQSERLHGIAQAARLVELHDVADRADEASLELRQLKGRRH